MDDVTKTDKMLARKDGRVGYVIFNNPERHNAVSLDMWAATSRFLEGFAKDDEVRVVVLTGAGGGAASRLGVRDSDIGWPAMRKRDLSLVLTDCAIPRCATCGSA